MLGTVFTVRVLRKQTREEKEDERFGYIIRPMLSVEIDQGKDIVVKGYVFYKPEDMNLQGEKYPAQEYREFRVSKQVHAEGKHMAWTEGYISKVVG